MDDADHRQLVSLLAGDLAWLEDHCRRQPALARDAGQLRLAAALVRNVAGPFLDGGAITPLHVAVVGGAGAGKSTVVNFLVGSAVAEANPQAGYTRHPTAYLQSTTASGWSGHLGFLGSLRKLDQPAPADLDQDVYQVRRVPGDAASPLGDVIVWDCPDMTTWAASGYVPRLIEVAALADVIVYVASDERYNDEMPTQFLHLLVRAGKAVVVVLTKMSEAQTGRIVEHFEGEVLSRLPKATSGRPAVPVLAVPYLTSEQLADPAGKAAVHRIPLINQVMVLTDPTTARKRTVDHALQYLSTACGELLDVAQQDLAAMDAWRGLVQSSRADFDNRYRTEFLNGEGFRRFDEARTRLLDLLELPGAGRAFAMTLFVLRMPYRGLRSLIEKALIRPAAVNVGEAQVLEGSFRAWIDQLRAEAIRRADSNPLWKHISQGFNAGLTDAAHDQFQALLHSHQLSSAEEIEGAARAVTAGLEQNPAALASLRAGKLLLDVAAIILAIWAGGLDWPTIVYIFLFVSLAHQVVELIVRQYVEGRRSAIRSRKMSIVSHDVSGPMADWLARWPATGGSAYEKLQGALRRVPDSIAQLRRLAEPRLRA
ncbi:MAG TPA: GTPase [Gemmataceae bacterium]|jgi:ethanolamine utilization protein EutP (predicted NTPase)|nr:GTPase [Gemmataceae bacterium]